MSRDLQETSKAALDNSNSLEPNSALADGANGHSPANAELDMPWDHGLEDESWERVVEGYEHEAKALGNDPMAAPLWYEAGIIYEDRLGRTRPAAICFQNAFKIDPKWRPNIQVARRLFTEVGNWSMVAQLLQAEADATEDDQIKAELLLERALLLNERLDRSSDATLCLTTALELSPNNLLVLKYIESLAARSKDHARLAETCILQAASTESVHLKVAFLCVAAGIFAWRLGDTDRAIRTYQDALAIDPAQSVALCDLDQLLASSGNTARRLDVLKAKAYNSPSEKEAAAAWYEAARLAEEGLGQPKEAIRILEEARSKAPSDPTILTELARRYEDSLSHDSLVEVLAELALVTEDPLALGEIHLKLGSLFDTLGRSQEAASAYRKAIEARPADPAALTALGKLYFRAERWEELIWTFEQEMQGTEDPKQRARRGFKIAEIQELRMKDLPAAIDTLKRTLDESPGYLPAVQSLTRLYETTGLWLEMIALLERETIESEDPEQKVVLLERIARVQEERLGDLIAASVTWEKAVALRPSYLPAFRSLARLYRTLERWSDLIHVLEQEAGQVDDQRQVIALLHNVAELYEERLNDSDAAIEAYRKVLDLQPSFLPALKSLGQLCEQTGRWSELIEMFRRELEVTTSLDHVISLLMKIGSIYERHLSEEDKAIETYEEVLNENENSLMALIALERLYTRAQEWDKVVEVLIKQSDILTGKNERALILTRAANLLESRLSDPERACATAEAALNALPNHTPALHTITRIHAAKGDWQILADTYVRILGATSDITAIDIRRRLGLLYMDRLSDPEAARACFEVVLDSSPVDPISLVALDILYTTAGQHSAATQIRTTIAEYADSERTMVSFLQSAAIMKDHLSPGGQNSEELWARLYQLIPEQPSVAGKAELFARRSRNRDALKSVYASQLDRATGDDFRLAYAMRVGELASEDHLDSANADAAFRKALEIAPNHLPAIRGLKRTLAAAGRWNEVQVLLEREGDLSRDPKRATHLLFEAGLLREEHLADVEAAERNYQKVLERDVNNDRAYERLTRLLEKGERYTESLDIHRWKAGVSADPVARSKAWFGAALIMAKHLQDYESALSAIEDALRLNPAFQEALELGAELARSMELWEKAAFLYSKRIEVGGDPLSLNPFRLGLAILNQEHLGALDRAARWLQDVISVDPKNTEALRRLADIYVAAGNWTGATMALSDLADSQHDANLKASILIELADIHSERQIDTESAITTLNSVLEIDPSNLDAVQRLGSLYESNGRWNEIVDLYTRFMQQLPDEGKDKKYPVLVRIAELQAGPLESFDKAIESYRTAIELKPDSSSPRIALADILAKDVSSPEESIIEHQQILDLEPLRIESYHALFSLFTQTEQNEKAWVSAAILTFLGEATNDESLFYADRKKRAPATTDKALNIQEIFELLRHPEENGTLADLFLVIGNQLSRVYPPELDRFQVGRGERLGSRDESPLRKICNSITNNLGVPEFELYRADKASRAIEAFAAEPPILVLGSDLLRQHSVQEQRYLLGKLICKLALGTTLCLKLDFETLAATIQAAVQIVVPQYQGIGMPNDPNLSKRLAKSMSRKSRKALEEPARRLAKLEETINLDAFRNGVMRTSERAGLLLCADVETGLSMLAAESGKKGIKNPASNLRGVRKFEEALRFFLSDSFFILRKKMKLSLE